MVVSLYQTPMTSNSESSSISTIIPSPDTSERTGLELIRCKYTWPELYTFVKNYVSSCTTCTYAKVPRHKPYGLLKQLPIPKKPWNSISMDFIEQLSPSSGFTSILIVIDHLSKQCIFILLTTWLHSWSSQSFPSSIYSLSMEFPPILPPT